MCLAILGGGQNFSSGARGDRAAVYNVLRFIVSCWDGLFYHYDYMEILRANNGLERFVCKF